MYRTALSRINGGISLAIFPNLRFRSHDDTSSVWTQALSQTSTNRHLISDVITINEAPNSFDTRAWNELAIDNGKADVDSDLKTVNEDLNLFDAVDLEDNAMWLIENLIYDTINLTM